MIIVSQDKKVITNLENIIGVQIKEHIANSDGQKDYEIQVITEKRNCNIGVYDTEERAKKVLQEIINTYKFNKCEAVGQNNAVYKMPEA